MVADDLVTQGARTSAPMVLASLSQNNPLQHQMVFCGIHPRAFSQQILMNLIHNICFKITLLYLHSPGTTELLFCLADLSLWQPGILLEETPWHFSDHRCQVNWMESLIGNTPSTSHHNSQTETLIPNISFIQRTHIQHFITVLKLKPGCWWFGNTKGEDISNMVLTWSSWNIPIKHQMVFSGIHPTAFSQEVLHELNHWHILWDYTYCYIPQGPVS